MLALQDEIQNEVYEHIVSVIGHERDPVCITFNSDMYILIDLIDV